MPDTRGFEVVVEISGEGLLRFLLEAWKSGAARPSSPIQSGTIPEYFDIPADLVLDEFDVEGGRIYIPREKLGLEGSRTTRGSPSASASS